MKLEFKKLGHLSDPKNWAQDANKPGIYLWIENWDGKRGLIYIGKHLSSVYGRNLYHYEYMVSGQEPVPERYFENQDLYLLDNRKKDRIGFFNDQDAFKKYLKYSFAYRDNIEVFYVNHNVDVNETEAVLINFYKPSANRRKERPKKGLIDYRILLEGKEPTFEVLP